MALLQRYSCCSTTSSLAGAVHINLQPRRAVLYLGLGQKLQSRLSVCRASSGVRPHAVLPEEEAGQQFFKDESTGVVCYHEENGDVTCEGWDEGPHFQPDLQQQPTLRRRRFAPRRAVLGRSDREAVLFENVAGRMGNSLTEVANESLECSEL